MKKYTLEKFYEINTAMIRFLLQAEYFDVAYQFLNEIPVLIIPLSGKTGFHVIGNKTMEMMEQIISLKRYDD